MSFREYMDDIKREFKVLIFGTDIGDDAIATARSGVYPPNIVNDVTPERLRRFFVKEENGYRVKKDIREMVVFRDTECGQRPAFYKAGPDKLQEPAHLPRTGTPEPAFSGFSLRLETRWDTVSQSL